VGRYHHPDERVEDVDVAAALAAGAEFLDEIASAPIRCVSEYVEEV
jgi:hypothetical protein